MKRSVLVTGSTAGLGTAIAATFLAAGYNVAVTGRDLEKTRAVAASLGGDADNVLALELDVRQRAHFEQALGAMVSAWGGADVLVNNAAVTMAKPVLDITTAEFNAVMELNAGGVFTGSQVFGAYFRDKGVGRIVNLASLAGQNGGTATGAHYAASKGAILTLTKVFARDLAPFGVTVNAVAPGPLESPAVHRTIPDERLAGFLTNIPVGALGGMDFVADMVLRLAAPEASFVTGATWDINGGLFMR